MVRSKRKKTSVRRTASVDQALARISSIASSPINSNFLDVNAISTPTGKNKRKQLKHFLKEEDENIKRFEKIFIDDIESFETEFAMKKLTISSSFLYKPLKSFKVYREKYAVDEIENVEKENSIDGISIPSNKTNSTSELKKLDVPDVLQKDKKKRSKLVTRTPVSLISSTPITTITPKVNMNKPLTVIRHARIGEQAVSMSGSPLMLSSVPREDVATVSVPLQDGRIATILPTPGFQREHMPSLNDETKVQLKKLYKNLATFFSSEDSDINDDTENSSFSLMNK
ncbi:borealin-related [Lycorma delicatula]|uniref:borealin-related n=1 Tax=Lycorma delicatula TaxID=130591 RepID=UPI003F512DB1